MCFNYIKIHTCLPLTYANRAEYCYDTLEYLQILTIFLGLLMASLFLQVWRAKDKIMRAGHRSNNA